MRQALAWSTALTLVTLAGCEAPTGLHLQSFPVEVAGVDRDAARPFVVHTNAGWTVEYTTAQLSLAAAYLWAGPPSSGNLEAQGRAVAETLRVGTIDGLDPQRQQVRAMGLGDDETILSAEIVLVEADTGPIADAAGAGVAIARVAGRATRGAQVIDFDGLLEVPLSGASTQYDWYQSHRLTQIPVDHVAISGQGTLVIRVDPTYWLDDVDFTALAPAPNSFGDAVDRRRLLGGVRRADAFSFEWRASAP